MTESTENTGPERTHERLIAQIEAAERARDNATAIIRELDAHIERLRELERASAPSAEAMGWIGCCAMVLGTMIGVHHRRLEPAPSVPDELQFEVFTPSDAFLELLGNSPLKHVMLHDVRYHRLHPGRSFVVNARTGAVRYHAHNGTVLDGHIVWPRVMRRLPDTRPTERAS